MRQSERGSAALIGVLIALLLIMVALSVSVPSAVKVAQVTNENAAASQLAQLNQAEQAAGNLYGMYPPLSNLAGSLTFKNCTAMFLAPGNLLQAPAGYRVPQITGQGSIHSTFPSCGVVGYSSYVITLDPATTLSAQRRYCVGSKDASVHINLNQASTALLCAANPVLPTSNPIPGQTLTYTQSDPPPTWPPFNGPWSGQTKPSTFVSPNPYYVPAFGGPTAPQIDGGCAGNTCSPSMQVAGAPKQSIDLNLAGAGCTTLAATSPTYCADSSADLTDIKIAASRPIASGSTVTFLVYTSADPSGLVVNDTGTGRAFTLSGSGPWEFTLTGTLHNFRNSGPDSIGIMFEANLSDEPGIAFSWLIQCGGCQ